MEKDISGGGKLPDIDELADDIFNRVVRIGKHKDASSWGAQAYIKRTVQDALRAHALAAGRDAERLDYLESLTGRMWAHPRGKIWPLHTDIFLHLNGECSATIYLRDEVGRNAQTASGPTLRAAVDEAMRDSQDVTRQQKP